MADAMIEASFTMWGIAMTMENVSTVPLRHQGIRIESIDILRGLVIVLMALDHTRDFIGASGLNPRDVSDPVLFLTRWITHLCAPVFVFLAGSAIYFWQQKHDRTATARFLFTRGLWLIVLEFTLVKFGWTFNFSLDFSIAQVIWVLGWSMMILSLLIYLPKPLILTLAITTIVGHNLLDSIQAENLGAFAPWWHILHEPGMLYPFEGARLFLVYPIIPWFAVMAAGYCFGTVMAKPVQERRRWLIYGGIALIGLFVALRALNLYGDPQPWVVEKTLSATVLSFINCEKYPPSLLYLAMTLGPALLLLAFFDMVRHPVRHALLNFGRVPLFFYVLHLPLIHFTALILAMLAGFKTDWLFIEPFFSKPDQYGFSLGVVYLVWFGIICALYPLCRRFVQFKRNHRYWWLSYM